MKSFNRIILLILDACGIGALPDADDYGDAQANTICNIANKIGGLNLPNLGQLGLGNIAKIEGVPASKRPLAYYAKLAELSAGKDSTVGHWELAGLISEQPFPVFPDGFPDRLISKFQMLSGCQIIGNIAASGTKIIDELGDRHLKTGKLIVYTSADSVFQIAAHSDIVPLKKLYEICQIARDMLTGNWGVARVIARPFKGTSGNYQRTSDRKDYSILPPAETVLDKLKKRNLDVIGVGKIEDLFAGQGLTASYHTKNNTDGVDRLLSVLQQDFNGLAFINLVDFDMLWGHRNDYTGFAEGLQEFDRRLPEIINAIGANDLLLITADHGCDPTITDSTDHTREYVPVLAYSPTLQNMRSLGLRSSFADIAQTIAVNFNLDKFQSGTEFLSELS